MSSSGLDFSAFSFLASYASPSSPPGADTSTASDQANNQDSSFETEGPEVYLPRNAPQRTTLMSSGIFSAKGRHDGEIGVSIDFIRKFVQDHQNVSRLLDYTASDLNALIIIPESIDRKCPYVDLFTGQNDTVGRPFFAPATVFVSHAWKNKFSELLDVLEAYAKQNPTTYFWIDLFIHNQNIASNLTLAWCQNTLPQTIKSIGTMLLVLAPWKDPTALSRAWCIWEVVTALNTPGVKIVGRLPSIQMLSFKANVLKYPKNVLASAFTVSAEKSQAFKASDRDVILKALEAIGFAKINQLVGQHVRLLYTEMLTQFAEEFSMGSSIDEASLMYQVALGFKELGQHVPAEAYLQKAMTRYMALVGATHPDFLRVLNALGETYVAKGELQKGIETLNKVLATLIANMPPDHVDIAASRSSLADAFCARGLYDQAIELYEEALNTFTKQGVHAAVLRAATNMGAAYEKKNMPEMALSAYQRALISQIAEKGPTDLDVARLHARIAALGTTTGNTSAAIDGYTKAIAIYTATSPAPAELLACYQGLAKVYDDRGDVVNALAIHEQAMRLEVRSMPADQPSAARAYIRTGLAYLAKGHTDATINFFKNMVQHLAKLDARHRDTAACYSVLGKAYDDKTEAARAIEYFERAFAITASGISSDEDPASSFYKLGTMHDRKKEYPAALQYFRKALAMRTTAYGADHPSCVQVSTAMAGAYKSKGDPMSALTFYEKSLASMQNTSGSKHPDMATLYGKMGGIYEERREFARAVDMYTKEVAMSEATLGDRHPSTAICYHHAANACIKLGDGDNARIYLTKAVQGYMEALGAAHPSTVEAASLLASLN